MATLAQEKIPQSLEVLTTLQLLSLPTNPLSLFSAAPDTLPTAPPSTPLPPAPDPAPLVVPGMEPIPDAEPIPDQCPRNFLLTLPLSIE